jgi:hypothetical protein
MANPQHAQATGVELHEDKRIKQPVRAASTANIASLSAPGAAMDGVTLASGDRILLKDQTTTSQNGVYIWTGAAAALTRATDATSAADFGFGFLVYVREGTANGGKTWQYTTSTTPVVVGTTALAFTQIGTGAGTVTSVALTAPSEFSVTGSPVTTTGTLAIAKANQSANQVYAGPTTGAAAAPAFRAVVPADLPVFVASGGSHAAGAVPDPGSSAGTTKFLREDATFAVPAGGGGGGAGGSGVPLSAFLSANLAMPTAGTYYDGPTITVPAGTWLLIAAASIRAGAATDLDAKLWDGTTVLATAEGYNGGSTSVGEVTVSAIVTPSTSTTYKMSAATQQANSTMQATMATNAAGTLNATWIIAVPIFGYSQSTTAPALATSGTITTSGVTTARVSPAGAVTGVILQAGTYAGQPITVINEAVATNSVTFAASGTSNVADGVSSVIPGLRANSFTWDSSVSLWFRS